MNERLELLKSLSGISITNKDTWENYRRKELLTLFTDNVYGRTPVGKPADIRYDITNTIENFGDRTMVYQEIKISFADYSFRVHGFVPNSDKPVPAFVYVMHEYQEERTDLLKDPNNQFVPVLDITDRGYALFVLPTSEIYPDWDHHADYCHGIFKVFSPDRSARRDNDWATISAWAWSASRVMDYIETDSRIKAEAVAVAGQSRGGKTALWCGANDKRFAYVISNASGCMGAAMLRGKTGEHVKDINCTDWFCERFHSYDDKEELLPVDQHMLLALIAPRLLYVASSSEDEWSDPRNERLSCRIASEVYEKIYHMTGVVLAEEPVKIDHAYHEGTIGYHVLQGEHGITPYSWKMFMDFWDKKR